MGLADAFGNHVPQVPQHGHEWKRLVVCIEMTILIMTCACERDCVHQCVVLCEACKTFMSH